MANGPRPTPLNRAREMVDLYTSAEIAVLKGQSYSIGGQSLTRADLDKIRAGRKEWEQKLSACQGMPLRVIRRVIAWDD